MARLIWDGPLWDGPLNLEWPGGFGMARCGMARFAWAGSSAPRLAWSGDDMIDYAGLNNIGNDNIGHGCIGHK